MNLPGPGARSFLGQRVSALVIATYALCVIGFVVANLPLSYESWSSFMLSLPMRIYTTVAVIAILLHAQIGFNIVITDYIRVPVFGERTQLVQRLCQWLVWAVLLLALALLVAYLFSIG